MKIICLSLTELHAANIMFLVIFRLTEAQTEIGSLKRALDAAQHQNAFKDKDAHNAQVSILDSLKSPAYHSRARSVNTTFIGFFHRRS